MSEPSASEVMYYTDETRPRHMRWTCTCPHGWRSLGRLYSVSMGKGWVRLSTTPDCPEHDACHHYTKAVRAARSKEHSWSHPYCPKHGTRNCPS